MWERTQNTQGTKGDRLTYRRLSRLRQAYRNRGQVTHGWYDQQGFNFCSIRTVKLWLGLQHLGGEYRMRREGDLDYPDIQRLDKRA